MAHSSPASSPVSPTPDSLLSQFSLGMERPTTCCCGRDQCAYLEHNNAAMEDLERDLQSAAQIGQALLNRHEAYMAEAEEERRKMGASIDRLETEKKELEAVNARTIEENRYLLDQLEEINNSVSDSDAQILSLNHTLQSTRTELERLTVLATHTSQLEAQLVRFEKDQVELQNELVSQKEQERTAVQRWKGAERTVTCLQEQVDRIEREAREEHARHTEVVDRFERQRAVERELENAAGRRKGAAAATTLGKNGSNSVISHFVKDILQDNANLQFGIVELRDMLMGSNEEVENLREQMMLHQPVESVQGRPDVPERRESLSSELANTPTSEAIPDFHVHHHYHAAPKIEASKDKFSTIRRPKKRRNITSPGTRTPSSGAQTPRIMPTSPYMRATPPSAAATILSQTSVTIPPSHPSHSRQWSIQSSQTPSSVAASSLPSSPQSAFRSLSLFDTIDDAPDSSRPTTPGSTTVGSPEFLPRRFKRDSDGSVRGLSAHAGSSVPKSISGVLEAAEVGVADADVESKSFPPLEHSTILEEPEEDPVNKILTDDTGLEGYVDDHFTSMQPLRPRLHRANSHESILSTRGVDIPQPKTKRSEIPNNRGFSPRTSLGTSGISVGPVTSSTAAVGRPSNRRQGYDSSNYNRLLLGTASASPMTPADASSAEKFTMGKRVGGWFTGKWGQMPEPSTGNLRAKDALSAVERKTKDGKKAGDRLSTHIEPVSLDKSLLQESLGERFDGTSFGL